nr:unnamed protein product [Spirometra erinaceieuropaei]
MDRNLLVGREQVVGIGQGESDPTVVESGLLQRSVLGPILFLIYVDDCARALDCEVAMFSDNMKKGGPVDEDRLQVNLNRLEDWSNRWLVPFNVDSALNMDNLSLYRQDRVERRGGGCLLYIRASPAKSPYDLNISSFSGNLFLFGDPSEK